MEIEGDAELEDRSERPTREGIAWRYYGDTKYLFNCTPEHEESLADYCLCCSKC